MMKNGIKIWAGGEHRVRWSKLLLARSWLNASVGLHQNKEHGKNSCHTITWRVRR